MSKRLVKGFLIGIAGLFIFITILSLFIPSRLMVTRAVVINERADEVYNQIADLQNWKHWQPVFMQDSAKMKFKAGTDGKSDLCEWESNGRLNKFHITGKQKNTVTASLSRKGENDVLNAINILPLADSNQVQVEWNVNIKLKWYPWEKFYGIFIEKITGQGYEDALNGLKDYVEKIRKEN